jgi:Cdc6-like AAA superfamily ATPase
MPSIHGEDAVLRILDKEHLTRELAGLSLDTLGFDATTRARLRHMAAEPYGMLLVTGPTGSGKTTSLYALLSETHTGQDKVITIEDPVEYQLAGVLQIPVNEKKGLILPAACAPSCATTRTRSWSARSATRRPPRSPSRRPSPATWCSPPCTPTTSST